jgi:hypothetical protein
MSLNEENLEQDVQRAMEFHTELTPCGQKVAVSSNALVKNEHSFMASLDDIVELEDFNVRIKDASYYAHIRWLADQIKTHGYLRSKPMEGYASMSGKKSIIVLTDGYCRKAACHLAISEGTNISEVPLSLRDKSDTMEDMVVGIWVNNNGKKLTPLELGVLCKRMIGFHRSPTYIAERLGISGEYVSQLLTVVGSPSSIREMIQNGQATVATALSAIRTHGDQASAVLGVAMDTAKAAGKDKVTKKFMPEQLRKATLTKTAPRMYEALEQVKSHDLYASLPEDLRGLIAELLDTVAQLQPAAAGGAPVELPATGKAAADVAG